MQYHNGYYASYLAQWPDFCVVTEGAFDDSVKSYSASRTLQRREAVLTSSDSEARATSTGHAAPRALDGHVHLAPLSRPRPRAILHGCP